MQNSQVNDIFFDSSYSNTYTDNHVILGMKQAGKPYAGKLYVRVGVAEDGNLDMAMLLRHSHLASSASDNGTVIKEEGLPPIFP